MRLRVRVRMITPSSFWSGGRLVRASKTWNSKAKEWLTAYIQLLPSTQICVSFSHVSTLLNLPGLLLVPSGTPRTEIIFVEGHVTTVFSRKSEQFEQHSVFLSFGIRGFNMVFLLDIRSSKLSKIKFRFIFRIL